MSAFCPTFYLFDVVSTTLYLLRHTQVGVPEHTGVCYGQSDVPLAETAEADIAAALRRINPHLPAEYRLWSSPLGRCGRLAGAFGHPFETDERLKELHFGRWEMQPWQRIPPEELNPWMQDFVHLAPPEGERFEQLHRRAVFWLGEQLVEGGTIVAVTHAGVIRALLCEVLGMPLAHAFRIGLDYGTVTKVVYRHGLYRADWINRL